MAQSRVSANELSRRTGVPQQTLSRWLRDAKISSMRDLDRRPSSDTSPSPRRPRDWNIEERLQAVIRAASMSEQELGAYLRQAGLKSTDLERWRESMLAAVQPESQRRARRRNAKESRRIRDLEKELRRKDKALAEAAALLVLKKKAQAPSGGSRPRTHCRGGTDCAEAHRRSSA